MFLKFLFWYYIVTLFVQIVNCCKDHPRQYKSINVGSDVITLILVIAITIFVWFYAFGGWVVK